MSFVLPPTLAGSFRDPDVARHVILYTCPTSYMTVSYFDLGRKPILLRAP